MDRKQKETADSAQAAARETADDARTLNRRDRRALKAIDRKISGIDAQIAAAEARGEK